MKRLEFSFLFDEDDAAAGEKVAKLRKEAGLYCSLAVNGYGTTELQRRYSQV